MIVPCVKCESQPSKSREAASKPTRALMRRVSYRSAPGELSGPYCGPPAREDVIGWNRSNRAPESVVAIQENRILVRDCDPWAATEIVGILDGWNQVEPVGGAAQEDHHQSLSPVTITVENCQRLAHINTFGLPAKPAAARVRCPIGGRRRLPRGAASGPANGPSGLYHHLRFPGTRPDRPWCPQSPHASSPRRISSATAMC